MDSDRFNDLTRSISTLLSRRSYAAALGMSASALPGLVAAKKHHIHKHKKHHPPPGCVPDCQHKDCGEDGCGGSCGDCPEGRSCQQGVCVCPSGQRDCQGACIPVGRCCDDSECPTGAACCGEVCVDVTHDTTHCGSCDVTCPPEQICAGARCCQGRGSGCTGVPNNCCGTDACFVISGNAGVCEECLPSGSECPSTELNLCCPGLFCLIVETAPLKLSCASCIPEGEPCPQHADCCAGLFCQNGICKTPGPG
jgi:hypothetical protein